MANAPIVAVSDTGTEPLDSTVDALETGINAGFSQAYEDLVHVDVMPNAGAMINLPKATGTENALVTVKPAPFEDVPLAGDQKFWLRRGRSTRGR